MINDKFFGVVLIGFQMRIHFYCAKKLVFQEHALFLPIGIVIFLLKISYTGNCSFDPPEVK